MNRGKDVPSKYSPPKCPKSSIFKKQTLPKAQHQRYKQKFNKKGISKIEEMLNGDQKRRKFSEMKMTLWKKIHLFSL